MLFWCSLEIVLTFGIILERGRVLKIAAAAIGQDGVVLSVMGTEIQFHLRMSIPEIEEGLSTTRGDALCAFLVRKKKIKKKNKVRSTFSSGLENLGESQSCLWERWFG